MRVNVKPAGDVLKIKLSLRPGFSGPANFPDGAYGVEAYIYRDGSWARADDRLARRLAVVKMLARPGAYAAPADLPARDTVMLPVKQARSYRVLVPFFVGNDQRVTWADS